MIIGVISDTHGSAGCWAMVYNNFFLKTDLILHAGDILYHGPRNRITDDYRPAKLAEAINKCPVPIIAVRGNCDSEVDMSVLGGTPVIDPYAFLYVNGKRILLTHGHRTGSQEEKSDLASRFKADIFISGHTHVPVIEHIGNTIFLNPGSPSVSKREDGRSTFALMDEQHISIRDLYTGDILESLPME